MCERDKRDKMTIGHSLHKVAMLKELIDTLATIKVWQLPPNESFNMRVRLESRYGMCFKPSANLLMQLPKDKSDLLILAPSLNRNLDPPLLAALSLPAKSIIESFTIRLLPVLESVIRMCTWKMAINKFCLKENQSTFETEARKFHLFPVTAKHFLTSTAKSLVCHVAAVQAAAIVKVVVFRKHFNLHYDVLFLRYFHFLFSYHVLYASRYRKEA
uniref:Uncharacterized protein n=1 Tax=Glossina pallidipes TaxID=7398 RepID=A0A1A9Z0N1_GLOPL